MVVYQGDTMEGELAVEDVMGMERRHSACVPLVAGECQQAATRSSGKAGDLNG